MTISIQAAIQRYLSTIEGARSKNTFETYTFAMRAFSALLADNKIDAETAALEELREEAIGWFATWLKGHAPATEQLYLQAAVGFYRFLSAEGLASPNLPRIAQLVRIRSRRSGQRLPQFPREAIEKILESVSVTAPAGLAELTADEKLRWLRDRAFLITLADTGLRVHEICALRRADVDWNEGRAIIIGKGNKQAVIRFSNRALAAMRDYLAARAKLDGSSGRPLGSLALFARHDKGAGKQVKSITTATGRHIVEDRVREILGSEFDGKITPHSFRHYFVTTILRVSGNLKLAQELARHTNISVTQRYAHLSNDELDKGYHQIFEAGSEDE